MAEPQPKRDSMRMPAAADGSHAGSVSLRRLGNGLPWTVWVAPLLLPLLAGGVVVLGVALGLLVYGEPFDSDNVVWRVALVLSTTLTAVSVGGSLLLLVLNLYFLRIAVSPRLPDGGHYLRLPRSRFVTREWVRLRYTPGVLELVTYHGEMLAACVCMLEFAYDSRRPMHERFAALLHASREWQLVLEVRLPAADPAHEVCHDYDPRRDEWLPGVEHD